MSPISHVYIIVLAVTSVLIPLDGKLVLDLFNI